MSRDATGLYSRMAVQRIGCSVCGVPPGTACDLVVEGYSEHGVHWARTEAGGPYDMPPADCHFDEAVQALLPCAGHLQLLNDRLLDCDLRVIRLPTRAERDAICIHEIPDLLEDHIGQRYSHLHVMADDLAKDSAFFSTWPPWECCDGVYVFRAGEPQRAPTAREHRGNVLAARRRRNDPDGFSFTRPPVAAHVRRGSPFCFVRDRGTDGRWESASDPGHWLQISKDMLLKDHLL